MAQAVRRNNSSETLTIVIPQHHIQLDWLVCFRGNNLLVINVENAQIHVHFRENTFSAAVPLPVLNLKSERNRKEMQPLPIIVTHVTQKYTLPNTTKNWCSFVTACILATRASPALGTPWNTSTDHEKPLKHLAMSLLPLQHQHWPWITLKNLTISLLPLNQLTIPLLFLQHQHWPWKTSQRLMCTLLFLQHLTTAAFFLYYSVTPSNLVLVKWLYEHIGLHKIRFQQNRKSFNKRIKLTSFVNCCKLSWQRNFSTSWWSVLISKRLTQSESIKVRPTEVTWSPNAYKNRMNNKLSFLLRVLNSSIIESNIHEANTLGEPREQSCRG